MHSKLSNVLPPRSPNTPFFFFGIFSSTFGHASESPPNRSFLYVRCIYVTVTIFLESLPHDLSETSMASELGYGMMYSYTFMSFLYPASFNHVYDICYNSFTLAFRISFVLPLFFYLS